MVHPFMYLLQHYHGLFRGFNFLTTVFQSFIDDKFILQCSWVTQLFLARN